MCYLLCDESFSKHLIKDKWHIPTQTICAHRKSFCFVFWFCYYHHMLSLPQQLPSMHQEVALHTRSSGAFLRQAFSCTENQFCFLFIQSHTTFQPYQHQYKLLTLINMLHTSQINMSVNNNNNHTHMGIQLASRSRMINNAPLQSNNQSRGQWSGFAPFHWWKIVFYV